MYMTNKTLLIALLLFACTLTEAKMITRIVEYKDANTILEGYLAYDDSIKSRQPAVLIVHEWTGVGPYVEGRARQLAQLGYVAFAIDIYGKGIRPSNPQDATKEATFYRSDRQLMRRRAQAGLDEAKTFPFVDPNRIAIIGYCFGGGVSLELARSGAPLKGVVSFHGNLDTPNPNDAKNIKAKILVCTGANDPFVPRQQVLAFEDEMRNAVVDWQMNVYGNAVHSFTNIASGSDPSKGVAYNKEADRRSWQAMLDFFKEIF
jgi:dienelactone hydrolase